MTGPDVALRCEGLRVRYGETTVLDGVDLDVAAGETVGLLGPSGSGKTTLLYAIAGFVDPVAGHIEVGGRPVHAQRRRVPPEDRSVGLVFQNYALWPHLNALETVAYPLHRAGTGRERAGRRARELLDLMGIGDLGDRYPDQLSGGQQQRVGVARALAREPLLYLLDEPTAHLDAPLRSSLQEEIRTARRGTGAAALYATHDAGEALAMADRVALLRDGAIVQMGTPVEVYERPVDLWAARLTGPASAIDVEILSVRETSATVSLAGTATDIPLTGPPSTSAGRARFLLRPDWLRFESSGVSGTISRVVFRGPHTDHHVDTPLGTVVIRSAGPSTSRPGDSVRWAIAKACSIS